MEGSFEDRWPSHRRRRRLADLNGDEPGEGEFDFDPGHHHYHYHPGTKSDKYYDNRDCSSDCDSDETISDCVPANYGDASLSCDASSSPASAAADAAVAVLAFACPLCLKEFRSRKAVCGHMKVHREQGIKKGREAKRNDVAAAVGRSRWGATGANRGCSGSRGRATASNTESDQSMAAVVVVVAAESSKVVLQPKPLAFAPPNPSSVPVAFAMADDSFDSSSSSPKPMHKDAMETVVVREANPPAAPVHHPLVLVAQPPPGDRRSPIGYTCRKCGMWFRTPQGLGGHMVGHKNRDAAVHDGAVPHGSSAKPPEKVHVCKVCAAEFPGGVQLGGHMRKHWAGPPINKRPRFAVQPLPPPPPRTATTVGVVADLTLALPVKADEALLPAAPRPAVASRRVLLFGIDIGPGVQTPAAQQGSSASSATLIGVHQ